MLPECPRYKAHQSKSWWLHSVRSLAQPVRSIRPDGLSERYCAPVFAKICSLRSKLWSRSLNLQSRH